MTVMPSEIRITVFQKGVIAISDQWYNKSQYAALLGSEFTDAMFLNHVIYYSVYNDRYIYNKTPYLKRDDYETGD